MFPRAAFVTDKALHSGFFVLHRMDLPSALHRVATFLCDNNTGRCYTYVCLLLLLP